MKGNKEKHHLLLLLSTLKPYSLSVFPSLSLQHYKGYFGFSIEFSRQDPQLIWKGAEFEQSVTATRVSLLSVG
ncbi:hypothetical protein IMY05_004G0060400 [Salix suchowensis]|nr:hypothetical protein IMY05_004G0060400 [Salix suchowensis]